MSKSSSKFATCAGSRPAFCEANCSNSAAWNSQADHVGAQLAAVEWA